MYLRTNLLAMMRFCYILIALILLCSSLYSQTGSGKYYKTDRYSSIYLPLGKISFADSVVDFKLGYPAPIPMYQDSLQCLHEPNYTKYRVPNFLSLGCGGSVTVAFTDNGFMNLDGNDIYIFEVGPSREPASLEISENGTDWIYGGKIHGGRSIIDLEDQDVPSDVVYYFMRITDLRDLCKSKSAGADIDAIAAITSVIKLSINADVLFDVDKFELKESANQTLDTLTKTILQIDKATLLIDGHTDSDGSDEYNMVLAENRCNSVVEKLKSLFGENALYDYEIRALGESLPRVPNDTDENKQLNRRVEITVLPPKDYFETLPNEN